VRDFKKILSNPQKLLQGKIMFATASQELENTFVNLNQSTIDILNHAFTLSRKKEELSRREYNKYLSQNGWSNKDAKVYIQVAKTFEKFIPEDLALIEPHTIFILAKYSKKYELVIQQLLDAGDINQENVREWINKVNATLPEREEGNNIWRASRGSNRRYCRIGNIWDEETGMTIQRMMDEEGITSQRVVIESVSLRQAFLEGRIIILDSPQNLEDIAESSDYPQQTQQSTIFDSQVIDKESVSNFDYQESEESTIFDSQVIDKESVSDFDFQESEESIPSNFPLTNPESSWESDYQESEESAQSDYQVIDKESSDFDSPQVVNQQTEADTTKKSPIIDDKIRAEIAANILRKCTSWEKVVKITRDFSDQMKKDTWKLLTKEEREYLQKLKLEYLQRG
jgi:hypothetical protein